MAAADSKLPLFGFVAKNPGVSDKYCHVFNMNTKVPPEPITGDTIESLLATVLESKRC